MAEGPQAKASKIGITFTNDTTPYQIDYILCKSESKTMSSSTISDSTKDALASTTPKAVPLGPPGESSVNTAHDPSHEVSGGTITAAVFGIVKAMVGPAILYLPHSFADAGYLFAMIGLGVCTVLYLYTSQRLLQAWKFVQSSQSQGSAPRKRNKSRDDKDPLEIEMASLVNKAGSSVHK